MKYGSLAMQRLLGVLFVLTLLATLLPMATSAEPPQQGPIIYYVRYGDTLFSIAMRYGTTVPAIMQANGLTSDYIYAGQRLIIPLTPITPAPTFTLVPTPSNFDCTYTVQYRDTVYSIGYRYGVPYYILMQVNYMYTPYLRVGQTLRVPCLPQTPTPFPTHIVESGENLFRIAIHYKTSIYAIALTNGIWNPHWIYAGQNLVIPYPNSQIWPDVPTVTPAGTLGPTNTPGPTSTPRPANTVGPTATRTLTASPGPSRTPTTAFTGTPAGVIAIFNYNFVPPTLTIPRGGTVMWQNNDAVSHTLRSGAPSAPTTLFSTTLASGGKFYFTFSNAGTYPFYSESSPTMTGSITVQ